MYISDEIQSAARRCVSVRDMLRRSALRTLPILAVAAAPLLLIAAGCGGGGGDNDSGGGTTTGGQVIDQPGWTVQRSVGVQAKKKWTFLVYMNGANDLEQYGTDNLNQMEQVGSDGNVNIVAQFKRANGQGGDDHSDGDWTGTRRFYVEKDSDANHVSSPVLSTKSDLDAGKAQSLQDFVRWGIQTYPADHYALVIWNHGAGWRKELPTRAASLSRGVSYDDETGSHIDTIELPAAINIDRKWDLVIWDSSLMQMLEVAYEIRNQTSYIVGSEESPPGEGYPYQLFLASLKNNPDSSAVAFGTTIVDQTLDYFTNGGSPRKVYNITQSLLDTSKLTGLASAVNNLGATLTANQTTFGSQIANSRDDAESMEAPYGANKDLIDFTNLLQANVNNDAVKQAAAAVKDAANQAILHSVHGEDHPNATGIALYIPSPYRYRNDDIDQADGFGQRYGALSLSKDYPNWQTFLANGPQ